MANIDIKQYALEKGVKLWEVSEKMGYSHESSFSRVLRRELKTEEKEKIFKIIDELSNVNFEELTQENAVLRYMSLMNEQQRQTLCACASQILLRSDSKCEQ